MKKKDLRGDAGASVNQEEASELIAKKITLNVRSDVRAGISSIPPLNPGDVDPVACCTASHHCLVF